MAMQVVFTKTDAILLDGNTKKIKPDYLVLTNPNLLVDGVPSRYWKIGRNNSVIEMNDLEKVNRDYLIETEPEVELNIFQPERSTASPVSKPIVIQEIKNTPVLHIETKEIRHLDIRPIDTLKTELAPVTVNPVSFDVKTELKIHEISKLHAEIDSVKVHPISLNKLEVEKMKMDLSNAVPLKLDITPVAIKSAVIEPLIVNPIKIETIKFELSKRTEILITVLWTLTLLMVLFKR